MAANPQTLPPYPITITDDTPNPDELEIPKDGSIQFNSDANYTITWSDEHGNKGKFWSPQPDTVSQGLNEVQYATSSADHHTLSYSLEPDPKDTQGGGTIKVGT